MENLLHSSICTDESLNLFFESDGFITDHLGNVAAVVNLSASPGTSTRNVILEQNDYTPFGMRLEPAVKTQAANRWRYAGKEEQRIAGMDLHLIDFGARYYDPFTCRWNATDPLAHKYFSMSPYNYCGNDPVNFFDPDGQDRYTINSDGVVELFQESNTGYDEVYSKWGEGPLYRNAAHVKIYDKSILPSMAAGNNPTGNCSRKDMIALFKFAANTFDGQEWGLYYNKESYELTTRGKASEVGTSLDGVTWKVHSHPNVPANDRAEIESMGYWTYYDSSYDSNGKLLNNNALWYEAVMANDATNYITTGIPSYVYFPVGKNVYKLTKEQLPIKTTIK